MGGCALLRLNMRHRLDELSAHPKWGVEVFTINHRTYKHY